MANQQKAERHVAAVHSDGGGGGGGSGSLFDKIKGGNYTDEQFRSLTAEEKKKVHKLREDAKKNKSSKRKERRKRKAARLKSDRDSASVDGEGSGDASSNAGAQFGSNGSKKNKN
jgi:hypothetical protein